MNTDKHGTTMAPANSQKCSVYVQYYSHKQSYSPAIPAVKMLDCIDGVFLNPLSEQFDYLSASVIEKTELLTSAPSPCCCADATMRPFLPSLLRSEDPAHFTHFAHLQSSRGN
jgi:hypothetical protein